MATSTPRRHGRGGSAPPAETRRPVDVRQRRHGQALRQPGPHHPPLTRRPTRSIHLAGPAARPAHVPHQCPVQRTQAVPRAYGWTWCPHAGRPKRAARVRMSTRTSHRADHPETGQLLGGLSRRRPTRNCWVRGRAGSDPAPLIGLRPLGDRSAPESHPMIQIGKVGAISGGEEDGRFVKINELPDDPPVT